MGSCCSQPDHDGPQDGIGSSDDNLAPVELPPGWKAVPSRSRPGKVAYQNIHTGERISWVPTEVAKTYKGGISKKKKKKPSSSNASATKKDTENGSFGNAVNGTNGSSMEKTTPAAATGGEQQLAGV